MKLIPKKAQKRINPLFTVLRDSVLTLKGVLLIMRINRNKDVQRAESDLLKVQYIDFGEVIISKGYTRTQAAFHCY